MNDAEGEHDGCPGMWLLEQVVFDRGGSVSTYRCELCGVVVEVPPDPRPSTC